jgi:hypothetical protein
MSACFAPAPERGPYKNIKIKKYEKSDKTKEKNMGADNIQTAGLRHYRSDYPDSVCPHSYSRLKPCFPLCGLCV